MTIPWKGHAGRAGLPGRAAELAASHALPRRALHNRFRGPEKNPLQVLKFGGTSVGDAACIARVVEIVRQASRESDLVVVVSAMSGVTNQLVAAAKLSLAGEEKQVRATFAELRRRHEAAAHGLIQGQAELAGLLDGMHRLLQEGERLCQGTALLRELTPRSLDAISGLGERLSVALVAAALREGGIAGVAVEATEVVVTDGDHGAADPLMEMTRERCETRLRPLLRQGSVPVVTGFIGATAGGVLTTLGRGGSDYSATIVGAALDADEVIIWTDVDGLQTADPRLVPDACTIPEVSYREAAELAYFGAKVLHPKTLRAVMQCGIPLWIRNTFTPEQPGTKITPAGTPRMAGVRALAAIGDAVMITIAGAELRGAEDVPGRVLRATASARCEVLLLSQASSQNDLCLVVSSALAQSAAEALRGEFAGDGRHAPMEAFRFDASVAVVTVVGQNLRSVPGILGRIFGALDRENVNILALAQGASECALSFVVAKPDVQTALAGIHWEFGLESPSGEGGAPAEQGYQHCEPVPSSRAAENEP